MKKAIFMLLTFVALNNSTFAQINPYLHTGVGFSSLTEGKGNTFAPFLGVGIEKNKLRFGIGVQFADFENLTTLNSIQGVENFYQMTRFGASLNINYALVATSKLRLGVGTGLAFAQQKLNIIDSYKTNGTEVTSTQAKETSYLNSGVQGLIDAEIGLFKKIKLFISPQYTLLPGNYKTVVENNLSDDFQVNIGLRYCFK